MFYEFFDKFLKPRLNFEHIQKEGGTHSSCVSQITDFQQRSQINIKKIPLQSTLGKETW